MQSAAEIPVPQKEDTSGLALSFTRRFIQGVEYFHAQTSDGGDLFLTPFGQPYAAHLRPDNWLDAPWFDSHRRRLRG